VYGLLAGIAVYAHMLNGLIVAGHLTSLLFLPRERVPWKQAASGVALAGLLSIPMALFVLSDSGQIDTTPPASLYRLVQIFYGQSGGHATLIDFVPGLTELPLLAYAAAGAMALWVLVRAWVADRQSEETWRLLFVLSWLCVPAVLAVVLSVHQSVLVPRYLVVIFPALVLWVSAGVGKFTPGAIGGLALAGLTVVSLIATASYFADYEKDDWRGASDFILDQSQEGDGILFYIPSTSLAFDYYQSSEDRSIRPTAENYAFDAGTPEAEQNPLYLGFGLPPEPDPNLAERLQPNHERVWLLLAHAEDTGEVHGFAAEIDKLESELSSAYEKTLQKDFKGVSVLLYERPAN
jgi:hypothetical protein